MAFANGHTAPAGFVAGQIKDGASFGTIDAPNHLGGSKFQITLRYYKNSLVLMGARLNNQGVVVEQSAIVPASWIGGIKGIIAPVSIPALNSLQALAPTESKITSLGLTNAGIIPQNATGDLIPFEQTADGVVQSYTSPADVTKQQQAAATQTNNLLTQLANNVTGGAAGTTPTPAAGAATGMSMTMKIVIGVVVAAVIGGIIYMASGKKKGGKGK